MGLKLPRRRAREDPAAPTLIIPPGAQFELDAEGHLSIRAKGNLVVQSSGRYGTLESIEGSIHIDRAAEVEASTVRCAGICSVQGSLTAWRVVARALHLEDTARAHIVFQDTAHLEIGRDARLVGNFASEGELLGLFARFSRQVRNLPFAAERRAAAELSEGSAAPEVAAPTEPGELPEPLLLAMLLLERESEQRLHPPPAQRALDEIIKLLQERDFETLRSTWRTLFGRIHEPRADAAQAKDLVAEYYGS
jgi:hypothetical protein